MMMRTALLLSVVLFGISAPAPAQSARSNHNVLTADDLARAGDVPLYDAISRLRPTFLRARPAPGTTLAAVGVTVYLDGLQMMEGLDHLRQLAAKNIQEVQYLEAQQANSRFGTSNSGGALLITSKK